MNEPSNYNGRFIIQSNNIVSLDELNLQYRNQGSRLAQQSPLYNPNLYPKEKNINIDERHSSSSDNSPKPNKIKELLTGHPPKSMNLQHEEAFSENTLGG